MLMAGLCGTLVMFREGSPLSCPGCFVVPAVASSGDSGTSLVAPTSVLPKVEDAFDEAAIKIYRSTKADLSGEKWKYVNVRYIPGGFSPLIHSRHLMHWTLVSERKWEPQTFELFYHYIDAKTVVVDFGTWMGVTVMYASYLADRVWGIEGDPAAFAECELNLAANPGGFTNVKVVPGLVLAESSAKRVTMKSGEPGEAVSSLGKIWKQPKPKRQWGVLGRTLPEWFQLFQIDFQRHVFIKIDVESYECILMPSFVKYLKNWELGQHKPTLYLSMHEPIERCSDEQYKRIFDLCEMYRFKSEKFCDMKTRYVLKSGMTGEFIFSDLKRLPFKA